MSFIPAPQKQWLKVGVAITAYNLDRGTSTIAMRFSIGADLLKEMGWKRGDRIEPLFGVGDDIGKAILRKSQDGNKICGKQGAKSLYVYWSRFPNGASKRHRYNYRCISTCFKDHIKIVLPPWFYMCEADPAMKWPKAS